MARRGLRHWPGTCTRSSWGASSRAVVVARVKPEAEWVGSPRVLMVKISSVGAAACSPRLVASAVFSISMGRVALVARTLSQRRMPTRRVVADMGSALGGEFGWIVELYGRKSHQVNPGACLH